MSWEEFKEELKKRPYGHDLLEICEKETKAFEELDKNVSNFVIWLTGLGIGELAYILSNLNYYFNEKSTLLKISLLSLIVCIFSGLAYQLIRIFRLICNKQLYLALKQSYVEQWLQDINEQVSDKDKQQSGKIIMKYPTRIELALKGIEWSWKINVLAFFFASSCLVILMIIKITS